MAEGPQDSIHPEIPDANYVITEGKRRDSTIYVLDEFCYVKENDKGSFILLRCSEFKTCGGRARIMKSTNTLKMTKSHSHGNRADEIAKTSLESKMKRMAESSSATLKRIFDDVSLEEPNVAASVSFYRMETTMQKRRRTMIPSLPRDALDAIEKIQSAHGYHQYFQGAIVDEDDVVLLFASNNCLKLMNRPDVKILQADATFSVVPLLFYQLFTIFFSTDETVFPGLSCLMSSKKQMKYGKILEWLINKCPLLAPDICISDFETAIQNSFSVAFPFANAQGCLFHFAQKIWQRVQKLGLTSVFKNNLLFRNWIHMVMALPFLPPQKICEGFEHLKSQKLNVTEKAPLHRFVKYVEKFWLTTVGPNRISVHNSPHRTNNICESYHAKIKRSFNATHPNIWNFLSYLNRVIATIDIDTDRIMRGLPISRPRRTIFVANDKKIQNAQGQLDNGEITTVQFLQKMPPILHSKSYLTFETEDDHEALSSSSGSSSDDEITFSQISRTSDMCTLCGVNIKNAAMIPCGHINCHFCIQSLIEESKKCFCTEDVKGLLILKS